MDGYISDRKLHSLKATKSIDRRILWSSEKDENLGALNFRKDPSGRGLPLFDDRDTNLV